ncbi:phytanoyl-dioxygenase [Diplodia corticola]|uniref:Phytanoyl-dioxygenase n=1 Tax=Diplodia corticola TaxID=236234 RepID=A0A1J9QZG2_9PEZI|nr:phytanoyl-dioxygenase [Diplodia corticola]OJD34470.1 phytanoyl-dioxygenase [Diplodia corticola]
MWTRNSARLSRQVTSVRHARTSTVSIRLFASHAILPSEPISVRVSEAEVTAGRLGWRNVEIATRALHRDGLVVLQGLIKHENLDRLNKKMVEDAYVLQAMGDDGPFNYNKGNIQQDPPLTRQWWDPSIFVNPIVTQVTSTTLGPSPRMSFISGNTALPPSPDGGDPPQAQPTHTDADFDHPKSPFALVVNVPLVEMTPANGSTEVWLGTHATSDLSVQEGRHGERASGRIKEELLRRWREERPPCQPVVPKGAVVVRDLRLWHGGMPNLSKDPRVMLAMIHFAPWYRNPMFVELADELKPALSNERTGLQVQGKFMPGEEVEKRYLNRPYGNAYDFSQQEPVEGIF